MITLICKTCNKLFQVKPYRINKAKFCSYKCFGISIKGIHPKTEIKKGQHFSLKTEYKKGNQHPYFGKSSPVLGKHWKLSEESKQKQSKAQRYKPHSYQLGKNHWNWKGGISPEFRKIRHSIEWKIWRDKVYLYDDWTCWVCENRGRELHPHHLKSFTTYPESKFKISNGITLCRFCHYTYGNHQK